MLACGKFRQGSPENCVYLKLVWLYIFVLTSAWFKVNQSSPLHGIDFDGQGLTINSSAVPKTCPFSGLKNGPGKEARPLILVVSEEERLRSVSVDVSETSKCVPRNWAHFWGSF